MLILIVQQLLRLQEQNIFLNVKILTLVNLLHNLFLKIITTLVIMETIMNLLPVILMVMEYLIIVNYGPVHMIKHKTKIFSNAMLDGQNQNVSVKNQLVQMHIPVRKSYKMLWMTSKMLTLFQKFFLKIVTQMKMDKSPIVNLQPVKQLKKMIGNMKIVHLNQLLNVNVNKKYSGKKNHKVMENVIMLLSMKNVIIKVKSMQLNLMMNVQIGFQNLYVYLKVCISPFSTCVVMLEKKLMLMKVSLVSMIMNLTSKLTF